MRGLLSSGSKILPACSSKNSSVIGFKLKSSDCSKLKNDRVADICGYCFGVPEKTVMLNMPDDEPTFELCSGKVKVKRLIPSFNNRENVQIVKTRFGNVNAIREKSK